jgi:hypothetical protein
VNRESEAAKQCESSARSVLRRYSATRTETGGDVAETLAQPVESPQHAELAARALGALGYASGPKILPVPRGDAEWPLPKAATPFSGTNTLAGKVLELSQNQVVGTFP